MQYSPKNFHNKILGAWGELRARRMLQKKGYRILKTNYSCPYGEADIIAQDGEEMVFIEVKTRSNAHYGSPVEAVTAKKRQKYYQIASHYVKDLNKTPVRFDVVEVLSGEITHLKNAF